MGIAELMEVADPLLVVEELSASEVLQEERQSRQERSTVPHAAPDRDLFILSSLITYSGCAALFHARSPI